MVLKGVKLSVLTLRTCIQSAYIESWKHIASMVYLCVARCNPLIIN